MAALKDIVAKRKSSLYIQPRTIAEHTSYTHTHTHTAGFLDDILGSVCKPGQWKVRLCCVEETVYLHLQSYNFVLADLHFWVWSSECMCCVSV